jgi:hypothetical protein
MFILAHNPIRVEHRVRFKRTLPGVSCKANISIGLPSFIITRKPIAQALVRLKRTLWLRNYNQIIRSVIAFNTARVRSRVPSLSRISDT